jgi:recombinational DNA repair protein RecT
MGEASLVPFGTECQLIPGYTGLMKLATNTGKVKDIYAHEVRENDYFKLTFGLDRTLEHVPLQGKGGFPATDEARGQVVGYYSVGVLMDGSRTFQAMSIQDVEKIRDKSAGYKNAKKYNSQSTWLDYPVEMGKKTVIRRICKYLPKSPELMAAIALDSVHEVGGSQSLTIDDAINGTWTPDYSDQTEAIEMKLASSDIEPPDINELFQIQFEKPIAEMGSSMVELDKFLLAVAEKHKMPVETAMQNAIKESGKFLAAFKKNLAKKQKAEAPKDEKPPILCPAQKKGVLPMECMECPDRINAGCDAFTAWEFDEAQK